MNRKLKLALLALPIILLGSCAKVSIKDGIQAYEDLRYQDAIVHLEKGLSKEDSDPGRRALAESYLRTNSFMESKEIYEQLMAGTSATDNDRINYGRALMSTEDYSKATEVFSGVLSREPGNEIAQTLKSACKNMASFLADSGAYDVEPLSLSDVTAAYAPHAVKEGIYFSAERSAGGEVDQYTGLKYTDLYFMSNSGDSLSKPMKVEGVNGKYHDGIASVSADGSKMILTKSYYNEQNKQLLSNAARVNMTQLYISEKNEEGKWGAPKLLPFNDENYMYAHPALSADGSTLYFASDMQGGYGGMDLYKTNFANDVWSKPQNLGGSINSPGNELFPSLRSADSLYFSSNAHNSVGGQDLNYAVQSGTVWNGPFHLPTPINTPYDDFGITFTPGSKKGYFSSDRLNSIDHIYSFVENDIMYTLNGVVTRKVNGEPISNAMVTLMNLTDDVEEEYYSDDVGMFEIPLIPGKNYRVRVEEPGYFAINEDISTKGPQDSSEKNLNIAMLDISNPDSTTDNGSKTGNGRPQENGNKIPNGITENAPYAIPNIQWDYNKWNIREDSKPYLNYVAKLLKDNPSIKVEISSHCDSRGSDFFNQKLSEKRAKEVTNYLVKKGIKRSLLISKGYGESMLMNNCDDNRTCSESEHQNNRRTEFKVLN
ncbi:MAG: peptidoglycan-associated lipoprotein [Flavobacteriales bacterium]|jgi:peptidoglycan-associated lipoprotein